MRSASLLQGKAEEEAIADSTRIAPIRIERYLIVVFQLTNAGGGKAG
jgi:hypothetical protein